MTNQQVSPRSHLRRLLTLHHQNLIQKCKKHLLFGLLKIIRKKNYAEAVRQAQSVLEKNYVDLDAHMLCRIAYREMGNLEKHDFHNSVLKGLASSLYASGNGTTPEKAIVVISVREEYFFMNANGLKSIKSSSITANGHHYDAMDVENKKTAEKTVIYFNIDIPYGWLTKNLQKK